jgi:Bacterial membrane protein YfhO
MKRAIAGLFLLVIAVYWKLVIPGSVWFDHYDLCQLEIPRLDFLARCIHAGHFPLWDPHVWAGLPVLGSGQPVWVYPLNLPFLALPLHDGAIALATLNWWFITVRLIGALGCFLLCREVGSSRIASMLGGMAFACTGYFASMPWLDNANGVSLAPFIVLFAIRIWTGRRKVQSAALLGLFLGLCWLSGHHETPLIMSYAVLLFTIALCAWHRRIDLSVLPAFVIAVLVSAIQTLPLYEFGHLAKRWVGAPQPIGWQEKVPYYVHQQYSEPWKGLAGLLAPIPSVEAHTMIFAGIAIIVLACLGVAYGWRNRPLRYVALLGAGGVVYSLGANTPVHRLAYAVLPMLDKARTPVRGMFLVGLALAVLAACGADVLLDRRFSLRVAIPLLLVTGALSVALHPATKGFAALAVLTVLLVWRAGNRTVRGLVLTFAVMLEATTVADFRIVPLAGPTVCAASMLDHQDLIAQLRREPDDGRIAVDWNELMFNPGDQYGFDQLQSFVAGVPASTLDLMGNPRARELLGVTRHVGVNGVTPIPGPAMPRAWAETKCAAREPVTVARPDSDDVTLTATLACPGRVILSDILYPGWEASVDGRPAPLHEAWGALRSVDVDAGAHTIEMSYRPASVRIGAALSATGLLACLALLVWDRRSRSR